MAKSDTFEQEMLDHIFLNADIALIGDAAGLQNSATAGSLYVSLHTADPGEAGNQQTNEATYGAYARVAVARSGSGWSRTGSTMSNVAQILFPEATSGSNTITHFGIGTDASGTGKLLYHGALTASLAVSTGIQPKFEAGELDISEG